MADYIVKRTGIDTIDQQIKVYMDSFGHKEDEFQTIKQRWLVKHFKNPNGESYVFGAFDGEELVGINCFLQMEYVLENDRLSIIQSCESGVLHTHQRKGIWGKIMNYAEEYLKNNTNVDMIIGFPNYRNSYPGFVKMGWDTLFVERNFLLVNNGFYALNMYSGKHWWNKIGFLLNIQRLKLGLKRNNYEFCKSETIHWENAGNISLVVDNEWIDWKKEYAKVSVIEVKKHKQKLAYIVTQEDNLNGYKYLKLLDIKMCSRSENEKTILASYLKEIHKEKYSIIRAWSKEPGVYKKLGFFEMKKHLNPFIVLLLKEEKEYLKNPDLWNPTFMDLD